MPTPAQVVGTSQRNSLTTARGGLISNERPIVRGDAMQMLQKRNISPGMWRNVIIVRGGFFTAGERDVFLTKHPLQKSPV